VSKDNPYNWRTSRPNAEVLQERALFKRIHQELVRMGGRFALVGGHGMGKSVLLRHLSESFDEESTKAIYFPKKPNDYSVTECLRRLARGLDVPHREGDEALAIIERWTTRDKHERQLVLLYDDIDRYIDDNATAKEFLNDLTVAQEERTGQLSIVIAGGLGVYKLREELGSPYMSRAKSLPMEPLSREDIATLAAPFGRYSQTLEDAVLDTIYALSGGNPALVTYALQECWGDDMPVEPDRITEIYQQFRRDAEPFEDFVYSGLGINEPSGSDANRVWCYIKNNQGPFARTELRKQVKLQHEDPNQREIQLKNSLQLLQASGLIFVDGSVKDDPLEAAEIPSILKPLVVDEAPHHGARREQFHHDMLGVLRSIHRLRLDFFAGKRQLAHERMFSGILAIYFEIAGWEAIRESQEGPGFVDVRLAHSRFRAQPPALVELKRWENATITAVHQQLVSYRGSGEIDEQCMAVVVIASLDVDDHVWREQYREKCLPENQFEVMDLEVVPPLPRGFLATRRDGEGAGIPVHHYLLNLRRRRR
jgi:hypothetical protein